MMRPTFVVRLTALGLALLVALAGVGAAEQPLSLVGATRDQVLARLGEPKSQIVAGNRVVLFFARERVVLRDGIVVEVERLPAEAPRAPSQPAPSPRVEATTPAPAGTERTVTPGAAATPATNAPASSAGATAMKGETAAVQPEPPASPPEPKFEIKSVRPPGSTPRAQLKKEAPPASTPARPAAPEGTAVVTPAAPTSASTATSPTAPGATPPTRPVSTSTGVATTAEPGAVVPARPDEPAEEPTVAPAEKETKAKSAKKRRRHPSEPDIPDAEEIISTKKNWYIVFAVSGIGVAYILWRSRQRRLALAATAVSRTPFGSRPPVAAKAGGVTFNNDLLQKLEWKRFEELVASYYTKTGVVAIRTKSGPAAPVHLKISWKGEPRPFAYVQCIAQPAGLIDAAPLQELVNVLTAEDIRRGYVVSTGKFGVAARDLAEEKHITLLPGDIFIEKLNALPDAARSELMQQATLGDYSTPSCPKCEAKMVRSPDDPTMWRCATHPDQRIPAKN